MSPADEVEQAAPDHTILRQISSIVAGLPTMDAPQFEEELATVWNIASSTEFGVRQLTEQEYSDVQLTDYLSTLTKQLSVLNDVSHNQLLGRAEDTS